MIAGYRHPDAIAGKIRTRIIHDCAALVWIVADGDVIGASQGAGHIGGSRNIEDGVGLRYFEIVARVAAERVAPLEDVRIR